MQRNHIGQLGKAKGHQPEQQDAQRRGCDQQAMRHPIAPQRPIVKRRVSGRLRNGLRGAQFIARLDGFDEAGQVDG